jgi:hypothetical protein
MTREEQKKQKLTALIARMPRDVRDEVARLKAEVADLQAALTQKARQESRIRFLESHETPAMPLPEKGRIRFLLGKKDDCLTISLERNQYLGRGAEGSPFMLNIHSGGFGVLRVMPYSSNIVNITT